MITSCMIWTSTIWVCQKLVNLTLIVAPKSTAVLGFGAKTSGVRKKNSQDALKPNLPTK